MVCLSVCRLSHSCTVLEPFDGFRCHLAGRPTLVGSNGIWSFMESLTPAREGDIWGQIVTKKSVLCCHLTYKKEILFIAKLLWFLLLLLYNICVIFYGCIIIQFLKFTCSQIWPYSLTFSNYCDLAKKLATTLCLKKTSPFLYLL